MARHSPSKAFELFFTPRFPLFFIFGALALAVMGNALTDLVKLYVGGETARLWLIFGIASGLLIMVVALAYSLGAIRARLAATEGYAMSDQPKPQQYRGLIAFVSLEQRAHLEKALRYHGRKLERVWLIATKEAEKLAVEIKSEHTTPERNVTIVLLSDQWDLQTAKAAVEGIYSDQLGALAEEDVIADFTGGTKPMAAGMIFACLNPSRHLEYVPAHYGDDEPEPLDPVEYFLEASTISQSAAMPEQEKENGEIEGQ